VVAQPRLGIRANRRTGARAPRRRRSLAIGKNLAIQRKTMDESKQHAINFLEKELKTYLALSRFFVKKDVREHFRVGTKKGLISPSFYKERMREAKRVVRELKNST
jgi:hypothetical protein